MSSRQPSYFLLTLLLLFLSLTGWGLISLLIPDSSLPSLPLSQLAKYVATPAPSPSLVLAPEPTSVPIPSPPAETEHGLLSASQPRPFASPSALPSSTPNYLDYQSEIDNFSVQYSTSRKVYRDKEMGTINRHTFYRFDSSFAIHIGSDWSWTHPERVFDKNALISGYPTFRYQADDQLLVDLETPAKKITLQCIHNGSEEIKSECQKFVTSFRYN